MLLDFILGVCIVILILQGMTIYLQVHEKLPTINYQDLIPKKAIFMQCHFCKVDLPWNTKRTTEGYLACVNCRYTKLNQIDNAS